MKKKKVIFVILILILILILCFIFYHRSDKKTSISHFVKQNQADLESYVETILENRPVEEQKYNDWPVTYYDNMVQFDVSSFGLVTNTVYKGFYYSLDGEPCGFQGVDAIFSKDGSGWKWAEDQGDNWGYTENIVGNWFYYEMHF